MFRPFLILLILASFLKTACAQQTFKASIVAGPTLAQLDGDRLVGYNKFGIQTGMRVKVDWNERWANSLELLFSQEGSSRTLNDDLSAVFDKIKLNFVEVPVMMHFSDWKFELGAGLSYARLMNYKVVDITGEDVTNTQLYSDAIYSLVLGVSFHFNDRTSLNVRWSKYLNDLQADPAAGKMIGRVVSVRGLYHL